MDCRTKQNFISSQRIALLFFTVCAPTACFRPAPPLEDGDGLSPSYSSQVNPDGSTTIQGHPVVLKRQKNEPKTSVSPTQPSVSPSMTPAVGTVAATSISSAPSLSALNVVGLKPILTGTCDSAAISHTATSTSGGVQSVTCDGNGVLTIVVHLPAGAAPFSLSVTTTHADGSKSSNTTTYTRTPFICPSGYVGVPGSGIPGLGNANATKGNASWWLDVDRDFCVMKYPAKDNNGSTHASSTMSGLPWTDIGRGVDENEIGSAFKACYDVPSGTFRLISNLQWQTVIRNAESVGANWSGGAVGSGVMTRGHADGSAGRLANSTDDQPYFGTGNNSSQSAGAGWEQRRTRVLTNNEIVWDFGGNVHQLMSDNNSSLGISPSITSQDLSDSTSFPTTGPNANINKLLFGPAGSFNDLKNSGVIYGSSYSALARGGASWGGSSGPFFAYLTFGTNTKASDIGFRCAFLP